MLMRVWAEASCPSFNSTSAIRASYAAPMFTSYRLIPRWLIRRMESSMSGWTPLGIVTPITRSTPSASTQRPATTELSLPPEMPMTALHPGPFSSNQSRIHWTHASLVFFTSNISLFL